MKRGRSSPLVASSHTVEEEKKMQTRLYHQSTEDSSLNSNPPNLLSDALQPLLSGEPRAEILDEELSLERLSWVKRSRDGGREEL